MIFQAGNKCAMEIGNATLLIRNVTSVLLSGWAALKAFRNLSTAGGGLKSCLGNWGTGSERFKQIDCSHIQLKQRYDCGWSVALLGATA